MTVSFWCFALAICCVSIYCILYMPLPLGCEAVCFERICIVECPIPLIFCGYVNKLKFTHAVFCAKPDCLTSFEHAKVLDEYNEGRETFSGDKVFNLTYYLAFQGWTDFSLSADHGVNCDSFIKEMATISSFTTNALKESAETRVMFDNQDLAVKAIMDLLEIDYIAAYNLLYLERSAFLQKSNKNHF